MSITSAIIVVIILCLTTCIVNAYRIKGSENETQKFVPYEKGFVHSSYYNQDNKTISAAVVNPGLHELIMEYESSASNNSRRLQVSER